MANKKKNGGCTARTIIGDKANGENVGKFYAKETGDKADLKKNGQSDRENVYAKEAGDKAET